MPAPSAPSPAHLSSIMSANRADNYLNAHMLNCELLNSPVAVGNPAGISIWHSAGIWGDRIRGPAGFSPAMAAKPLTAGAPKRHHVSQKTRSLVQMSARCISLTTRSQTQRGAVTPRGTARKGLLNTCKASSPLAAARGRSFVT